MSSRPQSSVRDPLNPEKLAYWYLRLNGFLQLKNFYIHPRRLKGPYTEADLVAVRFPHRAERLYDDPDDIMKDDFGGLSLSSDRIDVVIAEVKTGRCALNGPWTDCEHQTVHRVLAAIGCLPRDRIERAAEAIYETGSYEDEARLRIRLVAIGRKQDTDLPQRYPDVTQVIWSDLLRFVFGRLRRYRDQKSETGQWDGTGKLLKIRTNAFRKNEQEFVAWALDAMNVAKEC